MNLRLLFRILESMIVIFLQDNIQLSQNNARQDIYFAKLNLFEI